MALYLIFEYDGGALWVQWLYLLLSILGVFILRPYLLHKEVGLIIRKFYLYMGLFQADFCCLFFIIHTYAFVW